MEEILNFVIEGEEEISLDTLAGMLMGTSQALKKTSSYSRGGSTQEFIIKNITKGSFIITLGAIATIATAMDIVEIPTALSMFVDFLEIKQHLKGNDAQEVIHNEGEGTVNIINGDGNIITTNNYVFNAFTSDQSLDNEITKSMKNLKQDANVTGLRIENPSRPNDVKQFNLDYVSKKTDVSALKNTKERKISEEIITITKVDFEKDSNWRGYLSGKSIDFKINDDIFKAEIRYYNFTKGTKIKVDLLVEYLVDHEENIVDKAKYTVLEVKAVINDDDEQIALDLD